MAIQVIRKVTAIQYTGPESATEINDAMDEFWAPTNGAFGTTISNTTTEGFKYNYLEGGVILGEEDRVVNDWLIFDNTLYNPLCISDTQFSARYSTASEIMTLLADTPEFAAAVAAQVANL